MPVELHHFSCDITEVGNYFRQKYLLMFQRKNVIETLMACVLLQNQEEKISWKKTFFPGLGLSSTATWNSPSFSKMNILFFLKDYIL